MGKASINIVVIGDVDSGKSTTIGHLIYKLGGINESVIKWIEKEAAEMGKDRVKYAWVLDRLRAERECDKTIETKISKFETANYDCTVIDTPGHRDYLKNMITGTSEADCALLIIDSYHFDYVKTIKRTREHVLLAYVLGVKQIICCCNKIDAVSENAQCMFDHIVRFTRRCLTRIGFSPDQVSYVPISGFDGDNLTQRSPNLDWYKGPTLLEAIDQINKPKRLYQKKPLRLPISAVYNIGGIGTVAVGRVETGVMKPGMAVTFGPTGLTTEVKSIERHHKPLLEALPGDIVGFNVKNVAVKDLKCGYVASNSNDNPAKAAVSFTSHVILMNLPGQIRKGYAPMLDCHTCHMTVEFDELLSKIDRRTFDMLESKPEFLKNGEAGLVKMVPRKPMVVETFGDYPPLGRFALRDPQQTVGVGVIKSVVKKDLDG